MLVLLPLLAFAFLTIAFQRRHNDWRASFLFASIPWALFVAIITEVLTQFLVLARTGVALSWLGFAIACFVWMWRTNPASKTESTAQGKITPLLWKDWTVLCAVAAIVALVALTALASAPNTWDAMEYHLPRVVEWISNRGVQFFPTIDWSQLNQPPFAEYVMLHLDLLYGSDRLIALVQWFAYLGCIVGVTLLTRELGGGRRTQIVAAAFAATIPSAVLGASGAKNDCVATYWIVLAVYFLLRWRHSQSWPLALGIGAALGLAVFTKGTSYVFLPCLVFACVVMWNRTAKRRLLFWLPTIATVGILICLPLWVRNYQYTGSPLGFPYFYGVGDINGRMFGTAHVTPAQSMANVVRNLALHAGVPNDRVNSISTRVFSSVIRSIGVDPSDRGQIVASQLGYLPRFAVRFNFRNEVLSEDPIHLALLLLAGLLFLVYRRKIGKDVGWFGLGIMGAFIMYCALLRWSPWNARYQIPVFMLGAAFIAVVLEKTLPKWTAYAAAGLVLFIGLPLALVNDTRPFITRHGLSGGILTTPRDETYFFDSHREVAGSWIAAAKTARASGCRSIGLDANLLHFEYPMMAMLTDDKVPRQIRYVDVENSSAQYAKTSASPICMVVCLDCLHDSGKIARYSVELPKTQSFGTVVLFSRAK